jgi:hypothetical protein
LGGGRRRHVARESSVVPPTFNAAETGVSQSCS